MGGAVEIVMLKQVVVLLQNIVHFFYLLLEVLIKDLAHVQRSLLPIVLASLQVDCEHAVFVQFERIEEAELGLRETFIETFEIRLDHNEVERAVEAVLVVGVLQTLHFFTEIFL